MTRTTLAALILALTLTACWPMPAEDPLDHGMAAAHRDLLASVAP